MALFDFLKRKPKEPEISPEPINSSLVLVLPSHKDGLISYLDEHGIPIEMAIYSLEDVQYSLMAPSEYHRRVVIVDDGEWDFKDQFNVEQLMGVMELVNNVDVDATIFYTDRTLSKAISRKLKDIKSNGGAEVTVDITPYESMVAVYRHIAQYNEVYHGDGVDDTDTHNSLEYCLPKRLEKFDAKQIRDYKDKAVISRLSEGEEAGESLPRFEVKV